MSSQLKSYKTNNNNLKQELEDYKSKAAKILQSKEKLIASLKDGVVGINNSNSNNGETTVSSESNTSRMSITLIEIEELKNERDFLKEELQSKNVAIEMLKSEMLVSECIKQNYLNYIDFCFCFG